MIYGVIMAGGSGTRFWPRSTVNLPKQFLQLFGDRTMIQATLDRLDGLIPADRCLIVTNDRYVDTVCDQLPEVEAAHIIGEPVARNTAPCIASAAALIYNEDPDAVMVVLPADHTIGDPETFRDVLRTAIRAAEVEKSLVTVGIRPDRPETGYGYIRIADSTPAGAEDEEIYSVMQFTEKPDFETAQTFLSSGDYFWNSGMFIWKVEVILKAFELYQPEIYQELGGLLEKTVTQSDINRFYQACPSVSVDYGIMEHAQDVLVVPGEFGWNDVGSWNALYNLEVKDEDANAINTEESSIHGSTGNYLYSRSGKLIALVGVHGLAVVETDKSILICNLADSQEVKKVVDELQKDEKRKKFL